MPPSRIAVLTQQCQMTSHNLTESELPEGFNAMSFQQQRTFIHMYVAILRRSPRIYLTSTTTSKHAEKYKIMHAGHEHMHQEIIAIVIVTLIAAQVGVMLSYALLLCRCRQFRIDVSSFCTSCYDCHAMDAVQS